ncbi:MAG: InlB B-repeat-containing protein [Lentisphaerae bacterium]|nr:InlB B-repeat-containing protein [Lentisphaerota bacterium]
MPATMPLNGLICLAQWTPNQYTVTFNANGGTEVAAITQDYESAITAPANPTRDGYTFAGWLPAVPEIIPLNGLTCVAQWTVNQYTITFNANGGSDVAAITQDYNSAVTAPAAPTRDGYTFAGWLPAVPEIIPLNGLTCVAQWTVNQYTITFNANGGTPGLSEQTYNFGVAYGELPMVSLPDYTFSGWWTSPNGGTQITVDTLVPLLATGYTLYAHWELLPNHHIMDVPIHAGWNLTSAQLNLTGASQQILREKGAMKLSHVGNSYVFCDRLSPSETCWIYAQGQDKITLIGTSPENFDFEASLQLGWNFVGPLEDWSLIGSEAVAWGWNGQRFYPTTNMLAGHGYWLYWPGE